MMEGPPQERPSGFKQLIGFRIVEWRDGFTLMSLDIGPRHLNRSGVLHGGVISTMIDAGGGYAGCYCPFEGRIRRNVTLALSVQFLAQASSGTILARATVRGGGRRIFNTTVEVIDAAGLLLAIGSGTYRYRTGSEVPEGVPIGEPVETRSTALG